MAKYKLTGFARFFIFLVIATPIVYLAASYYNGQDGIANIKSLFGMEAEANQANTDQNETRPQKPVKGIEDQLKDAQAEINRLQKELEKCKTDTN